MDETSQPTPEGAQENNQPERESDKPAPERDGESGSRPHSRHNRSRGGRGNRRSYEERGEQNAAGQGAARGAENSVNLAELREIIELIDKHGFNEFELERKDFRVSLRRHSSGPQAAGENAASHISHTTIAPAALSHPQTAAGSTAPSSPVAAPESVEEDLHIITSPIVGTFYRASSPTAEPFVKIGSRVEDESTVCIIEAMKLMNEIQAEASGEIAKIYVENAQPVEFGQPLFGLKK